MLEGKIEQSAVQKTESQGLNYGQVQPTLDEVRNLNGSDKQYRAQAQAGVLDFSPDIYKIASNSDSQAAKVRLDGHIEEESGVDALKMTAHTDANGENPFGGKADKTNPMATKPQSYLCLTLMMTGIVNGGEADKALLNVNIPDNMKVNGRPINDGQEHRGVFPIVPEGKNGSHWHWIDASVTVDANHKLCLQIHKVSPSKEKPTNANEWDTLERQYPLQKCPNGLHATKAQYDQIMEGRWSGQMPQWTANMREDKIKETAVEKY